MTITRTLLQQIAKQPDTFVTYCHNVVLIAQKTPTGVRQTSVWLNRRGTNEQLRRFLPAEPDLAQAFDTAYEDQCRDACGL